MDPCQLVTADEATQLVGQPVTGERRDAAAVGAVCHYVPAGATPRGFVDVAVLTAATSVDPIQSAIDNGASEVTGVGQKAAGKDGAIVVDTGIVKFSITAADQTFMLPKLAQLQTLAQTVIGRLGGPSASPAASASASPSASASASGLESASASPSSS